MAGPAGTTRDRLCALFWPESDAEHARNALSQTLFTIRRDVRAEAITAAGPTLRLDSAVVTSDVDEFSAALGSGDLELAAALYAGPFLDGVHLRDAPEFERWLSGVRERLAREAAGALRALAGQATAGARDPHEGARAAVGWWQRLAAFDPADPSAALGLMYALAAAGDRTGALRHAQVHVAFLRETLDLTPSPEVLAAIERLRTAATPAVSLLDPPLAGGSLPAAGLAGREREGEEPLGGDTVRAAGAPIAEAASQPAAPPPVLGPDPSPTGISGRTAPRRRRAARVLLAVALASVASLGVLAWTRGRPARAEPRPSDPDARTVAVVPFRVSGSDSSLVVLREGLVDLLSARLNGAGGLSVVDPGAIINLWHAADTVGNAETASAVDSAGAIALAGRLGAGRVVVGGVVGLGKHLTLTASAFDVGSGRVRASAEVTGPVDSLLPMVDRLAVQLLAIEAGEPESRVAALTSTSLPAVRAYLAGRTAYRRGQYDEAVRRFESALRADSTFALAAFSMALAQGWAQNPLPWGDTRLVAWRLRGQLNPGDREFMEAFLGPRFPDPTPLPETLAAWERVVAFNPGRPEAWYEYGDLFFHNPGLVATDQPEERAAAAFARALELDPRFTPALFHWSHLAARRGDTALAGHLVRRYLAVDSTSGSAEVVRWRWAVSRADSAALRAFRARLHTVPLNTLHWMRQAGEFDGAGVDDAWRAALERARRSPTRPGRGAALRAVHSLGLNLGRSAAAGAALDALGQLDPASHEDARFRVLDALYAGGTAPEPAAARAAAARLDTAPPPEPEAPERVERYSRDICVLGQWELHQGRAAAAARIARVLRAAPAPRTAPAGGTRAGPPTVNPTFGGHNRACAELLDAMLAADGAAAVETRDAGAALGRLAAMAATRLPSDDLLPYVPLVLARLHERRGDRAAALRALRGVIYHTLEPHYLAPIRREEGRLAAALGDRAGAVRAYEHYLALRGHAHVDPRLRAEVATVRAELARLRR